MTTRVNGGIGSKETLTGNMDFFTVHTVAALEEGAWGSTASATRNLIKMVEAIATGAQPVLVSVSEAEVDLSVAGNRTEYGFGTGFNQAETTVYTLKFAIEHTGALGSVTDAANAAVVGSLANRLNGLALPFGPVTLDAAGAATKNVTVKAFAVL
jgi:hypothetical protein